MRIGADKNQFSGSHRKSNERKHNDLVALGCEIIPIPLPFGDYILIDEVVEETIARRNEKLKKQDLVADYFRDELIMAQKMGAKMYILIEDDTVRDFDDVKNWRNPRLEKWQRVENLKKQGKAKNIYHRKRPPVSAEILYKAMKTMEEKYGCKFLFCKKQNTARAIIHLLTKGIENE